MPKPLTADDVLPIVAALTVQERHRLLRLLAAPFADPATAYAARPVAHDEFASDEDALAWDSDGWEDVA